MCKLKVEVESPVAGALRHEGGNDEVGLAEGDQASQLLIPISRLL